MIDAQLQHEFADLERRQIGRQNADIVPVGLVHGFLRNFDGRWDDHTGKVEQGGHRDDIEMGLYGDPDIPFLANPHDPAHQITNLYMLERAFWDAFGAQLEVAALQQFLDGHFCSPFARTKMQSLSSARPLTMSSAKARQEGAPQAPQSMPGNLPNSSPARCSFSMATW